MYVPTSGSAAAQRAAGPQVQPWRPPPASILVQRRGCRSMRAASTARQHAAVSQLPWQAAADPARHSPAPGQLTADPASAPAGRRRGGGAEARPRSLEEAHQRCVRGAGGADLPALLHLLRQAADLYRWRPGAAEAAEVLAQGIVQAALARLLHLRSAMSTRDLGNALLSLAVLSSPPLAAAEVAEAARLAASQQLSTDAARQAAAAEAAPAPALAGPAMRAPSSAGLDRLMSAVGPDLAIEQLLEAVVPRLWQGHPQDTVDVAYALAKLGHRPAPAPLAALLDAGEQHLGAMRPKQACLLLWAAATLQASPSASFMDAFYAATSVSLGSFRCQDLSSAAWALGMAGQRPPAAWMAAFLHASAAAAGGMGPQALANTLWGVAALQVAASEQWVQCMLAACVQHRQQLQRQHVAMILWATARLHQLGRSSSHSRGSGCGGGGASSSGSSTHHHGTSSHAASQRHAVALLHSVLPRLKSWQPQDWANTLWACGVLQIQLPTSFTAALWRYTAPQLRAFTPQALASTVWAAGALRLQPHAAWLAAVEAASGEHMASFRAGHLVQLASGLERLGHLPAGQWWAWFFDASQQRLWACAEEAGAGAAGVDAACLLRAVARLKVRAPDAWAAGMSAAVAAAAAATTRAADEGEAGQRQRFTVQTAAMALHALSSLAAASSSRSSSSSSSAAVAPSGPVTTAASSSGGGNGTALQAQEAAMRTLAAWLAARSAQLGPQEAFLVAQAAARQLAAGPPLPSTPHLAAACAAAGAASWRGSSLAAGLCALSKLGYQPGAGAVEQWSAAVAGSAAGFSPRSMAVCLRALLRMRWPPGQAPLTAALLDALRQHMPQYDVEGLAWCLRALGMLGAQPTADWMDRCLLYSSCLLPRCGPQQLTNALAGVSLLARRQQGSPQLLGEWLGLWFDSASHQLDCFSDQQLAAVAAASLRLQRRPPAFCRHALRAAAARCDDGRHRALLLRAVHAPSIPSASRSKVVAAA